MYARAWALPVVQPLITLASGVVIANSVACALSMGAKGAGCGWFVGRLAAIVVHAYYASFLGLCDSLSFMRELLPAEWVRPSICPSGDAPRAYSMVTIWQSPFAGPDHRCLESPTHAANMGCSGIGRLLDALIVLATPWDLCPGHLHASPYLKLQIHQIHQ